VIIGEAMRFVGDGTRVQKLYIGRCKNALMLQLVKLHLSAVGQRPLIDSDPGENLN
jgi:hypothetical protein